jgi:hypothetical protein
VAGVFCIKDRRGGGFFRRIDRRLLRLRLCSPILPLRGAEVGELCAWRESRGRAGQRRLHGALNEFSDRQRWPRRDARSRGRNPEDVRNLF